MELGFSSKLYFTLVLFYDAHCLANLTEMISRVYGDCECTADWSLIVPILTVLQHRDHSLVRLFKSILICFPFLRRDFVDSPPDLTPIDVVALFIQNIVFQHFEIKVDMCDLRG